MKDESYLLVKSSIPFVLIGAARGDPENPDGVLVKNPDIVLVRGGDAEIDLVGFVREKEVSHGYGDSASKLSLFPRRYRSLFPRKGFRLVRSKSRPPISSARDQRYSTYVLAWKGAARASYEIEEQFNKSLPDILAAIDDNSLPQTEWALARLIFLVQSKEARLRRRQRFVAGTVILYVLAIVLALSLWLSFR